MLILTKNAHGADQWWKLYYDKSFVYINQHHHVPYIERDIDKHLFAVDYTQIRITPVIDAATRVNELRGCPLDTHPFVVRGRRIGPLQMRVRKYSHEGGGISSWLEKISYSNVDWNFTDAQKSTISKLYTDQIIFVLRQPDFEKQLKIYSMTRVVDSLKKQVEEQTAFLGEINQLLGSEKYQVPVPTSPLLL